MNSGNWIRSPRSLIRWRFSVMLGFWVASMYALCRPMFPLAVSISHFKNIWSPLSIKRLHYQSISCAHTHCYTTYVIDILSQVYLEISNLRQNAHIHNKAHNNLMRFYTLLTESLLHYNPWWNNTYDCTQLDPLYQAKLRACRGSTLHKERAPLLHHSSLKLYFQISL